MDLILTVVTIVAPVALLGLVGFVWVRTGHDYDLEFVTRLAMTLSVPALIFTALMKSEVDPAALRDVSVAAALGYGLLAAVFLGIVRLLGLPVRTWLAPLVFGNTGNVGLPLALFAFWRGGAGPRGGDLCRDDDVALHPRSLARGGWRLSLAAGA